MKAIQRLRDWLTGHPHALPPHLSEEVVLEIVRVLEAHEHRLDRHAKLLLDTSEVLLDHAEKLYPAERN